MSLMDYPHCKICGHLEQNHFKKACLNCSLIVSFSGYTDVDDSLTGYCGKDNLRYLELKSEVKR